MKIIVVNDDMSEDVAFSAEEQLPDQGGLLDDDGFLYQPSAVVRTYRRRLLEMAQPDHATSQAIEAISELASTMPTAPVAMLTTTVYEQMAATRPKEILGKALAIVLNQRYQRAIRFADDPNQLVPKTTEPLLNWMDAFSKKETYEAILKRAALHIDGKQLADTPFVSVARSEGQFLKHAEVSACAIIFGSHSTGEFKQAKNIYQLRIPKEALLTPEQLVQLKYVSPAVASMTSKETEALFYGHGIAQYIVSFRPNPYTRNDQQKLQFTQAFLLEQQQLEKEEEERQEKAKTTVKAPELSLPLIKQHWERFQKEVLPFLDEYKVYIRDTYDIDLVSAKGRDALWNPAFNQMAVRMSLRPINERLLADETLKEQWTALTKDFRS